jgi:hypothetical protein
LIGSPLGNKFGKEKATSQLGKVVILSTGTASEVLSFFDQRDQQQFNLLCKRLYQVVLPNLRAKVFIDEPKH